jgi:methylisocitrate lyase
MTPGAYFRQMVAQDPPLQIVGVINAYCALMAEKTGFQALYLSGAGVANASYGIPDIGLTKLDDVLIDAMRIITATQLPLLVDADTGFGDIEKTVIALEYIDAAGMHIEDQIDDKRCGQLEGKQLVSAQVMVERIESAVRARQNKDFVIMARTDAITIEGINPAILRAQAYQAAGADMLFVEAATCLEDYLLFSRAVDIPILANMTEFGKTPLYTRDELANVGVNMVLYPLSANRAMNLAALNVYQAIKEEGSQRSQIENMQTREQLYEYLDYDPNGEKAWERK